MMGAAASVFREQASWIPPQEDPAGDDSVVEYDVPPFIRQYKSGRVERYGRADAVPAAGTDDASSRDVVVNPGTGLWARLYLPGAAVTSRRRIPVVVFHHGGGFVAGSTAQRSTHAYLKRLAADAGVLVVSPEYRLAPEHPLPAALDGSWWEALAWVGTEGSLREPWLAEHGDLSRVFQGRRHHRAQHGRPRRIRRRSRPLRVQGPCVGAPVLRGRTGHRRGTRGQGEGRHVLAVPVSGHDCGAGRRAVQPVRRRGSERVRGPSGGVLRERARLRRREGRAPGQGRPDCDQARALHARVLDFPASIGWVQHVILGQ
ncbi:hypothetical protein QOZ80_2AG0121820 [Eleusine coracana subsp. coracana]|nr:hypothetical protein QOZ80_2AG0121820 [Eleusine coracana subsp. coracana]